MSVENVEHLRRGYAAFNADGVEAIPVFTDLLHPEFLLQESDELPDPDTYEGVEGLRRLLVSLLETFDDFRFEPREFFDLGDRVLVIVRMVGTGRGSGIGVDEEVAHLWFEKDGQAIRLQAFNDSEKALAAAGLGAES